uniref:Uncharacterized protein n=1 Tax=viral metagenome TaxID=1070528 RepID=A0A6C0JMG8_9ZZZZ
MTTIKKICILNRLFLPEVIIDIIKEYAFYDVLTKMKEVRVLKLKMTIIIGDGFISTSVFCFRKKSNTPQINCYIINGDINPNKYICRKRWILFCNKCGNFVYPRGYEMHKSQKRFNLHSPTGIYTVLDPSPFSNRVMCLC